MTSSSAVPRLWTRWLSVAFGCTALAAVGHVFFPGAMLASTMRSLMGSAEALDSGGELRRFVFWLAGVSSAVSLAWMGTALFIVWGPFRRGERWAWWALAVPIALWFIVDSGRSIATGFPMNALLNVGWLLMYAVPLVATFRRFGRRSNAQGPDTGRATRLDASSPHGSVPVVAPRRAGR